MPFTAEIEDARLHVSSSIKDLYLQDGVIAALILAGKSSEIATAHLIALEDVLQASADRLDVLLGLSFERRWPRSDWMGPCEDGGWVMCRTDKS